ncbi:hypothetical protein AJ79_03996 [Helicocarpus griseus UAMH5409]|uniref:ADP-ribosylglycohydrolase n=1 Tax=Helicocarpus griseus UAMH5409 TaxID=1447875 RepID=A0A2B7XUK8_9EURO|nr:hypothetical protein AJ79_03996 [Helicocarpus griseus UAMH5409]
MSSPSSGLKYLTLHPFVRAAVQDKIKGTIVGSALGDCIGLYTEFLPKSEARRAYPDGKFQLIDPPTEFRNDGHRTVRTSNKLQKAWTDDTDHALLIILSYLHHDGKELSPQDIAKHLRIWVEQGLRCLDRPPCGLGKTVGTVVYNKDYLSNPAQIAYDCWVKSNRNIAPNGSLMRTHPLGVICLAATLPETFRTATNYSIITHADPRCIVACCTVTGLVRGILRGEVLHEGNVDGIIEEAFEWVDEWVRKGRSDVGCNTEDDELHQQGALLDRNEYSKHAKVSSFEELELDDSQKMGYVYKAFGAAILALRLGMRQAPYYGYEHDAQLPRSTVFENIITRLTYAGGDADTNACVAGALLGSWLGYHCLPPQWRDGMQHVDWMVEKCRALGQIVGVEEDVSAVDCGQLPRYIYKGSEDPDTAIDGGKGLMSAEELKERDKEFMHQYLLRSAQATEREKKTLEAAEGKKKTLLGGMLSSLRG